MADDFQSLREALQRHKPGKLESPRLPLWMRRFVIMRRIDEIIEIPNENDRYGEPHIFEEADSEGRWMDHVARVHERRHLQYQANGGSLNNTGRSEGQTAPHQQHRLMENIATIDSHGAARAPPGAPATPGVGHRPLWPVTRSFGHRVRPNHSTGSQAGPSNVADRNKENQRAPLSFSDTGDSSAIVSDDSDDEGTESTTDAEDGELERISQLFQDFPTCIQKSRNANAIDCDEYGTMTASNPGTGWSHVDRARLPPRVAAYLRGFTAHDAAAFPDHACPEPATNGAAPHRWLLATALREFICDTSTLDVWYRPRPEAQRAVPAQQPL
jgi:hypothetical protein